MCVTTSPLLFSYTINFKFSGTKILAAKFLVIFRDKFKQERAVNIQRHAWCSTKSGSVNTCQSYKITFYSHWIVKK